jgi:Icc-related predicted phosphoesterase
MHAHFCISKKFAKHRKILALDLTSVAGYLLLMSPKKNKNFKWHVIKCLEKNNEELTVNSIDNVSLYLGH